MMQPRAVRSAVGLGLCWVFLIVGAIFFLLPIFWMISTSLKPLDRVFTLPIEWIPAQPKFDNYATAWNRFTFGRYYLNSFAVTASVTLAHVLLAAFSGYSFAKHRFFGKRVLF